MSDRTGGDALQRVAHQHAVRRLSAEFGGKLRVLRAHGVIRKSQKSHRYRLTVAGELLAGALDATRNAVIKQLIQAAA